MNKRFIQPLKHSQIHVGYNTRNLQLIIDYFIVRQKTNIKFKDVRMKRGVGCGADHILLVEQTEFPWIIH